MLRQTLMIGLAVVSREVNKGTVTVPAGAKGPGNHVIGDRACRRSQVPIVADRQVLASRKGVGSRYAHVSRQLPLDGEVCFVDHGLQIIRRLATEGDCGCRGIRINNLWCYSPRERRRQGGP